MDKTQHINVKDKTCHIYILMTDTGTWFTRLIRLFTGSPFNHASIAFDPELTEVYSFGRKHAHIPWSGGFVREDVRGSLFRQASCAVYRLSVSRRTYQRIRRQIRTFERNGHRMKYNLLGLVGVLMNKPLQRKNAYFCTQFVATVLKNGGVALSDKPPGLMKPADIANAPGLHKLYCGSVGHYLREVQTALADHPTAPSAAIRRATA